MVGSALNVKTGQNTGSQLQVNDLSTDYASKSIVAEGLEKCAGRVAAGMWR